MIVSKTTVVKGHVYQKGNTVIQVMTIVSRKNTLTVKYRYLGNPAKEARPERPHRCLKEYEWPLATMVNEGWVDVTDFWQYRRDEVV